MTTSGTMFCLAPGSETPLRVDPERYYETIKVAEKFDLIYWMCLLVQTVIEKCLGIFIRPLRPVFWFLGVNLFLVDTYLIASIFFEQRIHGGLATLQKKLDQCNQDAFKDYHEHLVHQACLSSITVGAFLDVLQLRLMRLPVLVKRGAMLLLEDVRVVIAAALCSLLKMLKDPLDSIQQGYLDTYDRNKCETPEKVESKQDAWTTEELLLAESTKVQ